MAKDHMLKFVDTPQAFPEKRVAELRAEDFAEIARRYAPDKAAEQASRKRPSAVSLSQSGMWLPSGQ